MKYQKHPKNVKALAEEIKRVIDGYWGRELTEQELREIILYWALNENKMLFQGQDYKPTIKQRIGSRRIEILNAMLEGYQIKIK